MTRGRLIPIGVAAGLLGAIAVLFGFDVDRSPMNLGVVSMICVSLSVSLVQLFSDASPRVRR